MKKVEKKVKKDNSKEASTKGDILKLGVMMEDMKDSISFVAETVVSLSDKVNNLEVKVDNIDRRLIHVESDVSIIKSDVTDIKFELKQKVDRTEFVSLVKRVEKLELVKK